MKYPEISQLQAVEYEIGGSWWAGFVGLWGAQLAGSYFAWLVRRKHARYLRYRAINAKLRSQP